MAAFGEDLRLERELRAMTLEVMSAETKVTRRYLEALEHGQFHDLPGGVFRRGILRAYLNALGLDESGWIPRFEAELVEHARVRGEGVPAEDEAWAIFASNVKKNRIQAQRPTSWKWVGVAALVTLVGSSAWAIWHFELQYLARR